MNCERLVVTRIVSGSLISLPRDTALTNSLQFAYLEIGARESCIPFETKGFVKICSKTCAQSSQ